MKKFVLLVLNFLFRLVQLITDAFFRLMYSNHGESVPPIRNLILLDSATTLALKIRQQKLSSEEVVEAFISRIEEINPVVNCVVDNRFKDALLEAKKVDEFIASKVKSEGEMEKDSPFLGVPFTTKDCISVKGLLHTAGLYRRKDVRAAEDADCIKAMREAGGIPLALSNVSELCMWWESYNTVHGRTHNPYNTNHIVGGSSGGEGCLLASAGSPMGIGSDIGGSIRMPCFFNGIFGHKPSRNIVPIKGQYPIPFEEQASYLGIGPMSRFATDLLPMFKVIAGKNGKKLQLDKEVDISKLNYYYLEDDGGHPFISPVNPEIKAALRNVVKHFAEVHKVKPIKAPPKLMYRSCDIWFAKMQVKNAPSFQHHLMESDGVMRLIWECVKSLLFMSNHTFIGLLTAISEKLGIQAGSDKHMYLTNLCSKLSLELGDLLENNGVFLYPTHPTPAPFHNEPLTKPFNFVYTGIFNMLGLPTTHCPLGLSSKGLPIGIQVAAGLNNDHLTLAVARDLEKCFGGWVPPKIDV